MAVRGALPGQGRAWLGTAAERAGTWWLRLRPALAIFLLSRLAFYLAAFLGVYLIPGGGTNVRVDVPGPLLLALHWRWDAVHYYSIAVGDYDFYYDHPMPGIIPEMLYAFFPLLGLLIRSAATLLLLRPPPAVPITAAPEGVLLAGVLVAHIVALLAFYLLLQLVREETGDETLARRAVLYAALFPLALFYCVPYTEGLLLATGIGMFLHARRGQWLRAGLWASAASAARPTGMLLLPPLLLEIGLAWRRGELRGGAWGRALVSLLLAPLGLLLLMLHQWRQTGDALIFLHAQRHWNHQTVFPLTTLWRGLGYVLDPRRSSEPSIYGRTVLHTLITWCLLAVLVASLQRWRPSYVLYAVLIFGAVLSSPLGGQYMMHSLGRFAMVLFPMYITLAEWGRRPPVHQLIVCISLSLFGLLAALFVSWHFVA